MENVSAVPSRARRRRRPTRCDGASPPPTTASKFLRRRVIVGAISILCHGGLALAAGEVEYHCQKSGCRSSPDVPAKGARNGGDKGYEAALTRESEKKPKPEFVPAGEAHSRGTGPPKLTMLLIEWLAVFSFLRLVLFVKMNGWKPFRQQMHSLSSELRQGFSRMLPEKTRSKVGGRRGSNRSLASLGSLADLIGWDDEDTELGSVSSSTYNTTGSSAYNSYYSYPESENDATKTTVRRGSKAVDDGSSLMSCSTLVSTEAVLPSDSSTGAVTSLASKKNRYSSKGRLTTHFEAEADEDCISGRSSSGSVTILNKFVEFLSLGPKGRNKKEDDAHTGGKGKSGGSRQSSLDDNALRHTLDRPLMYESRTRRSTVDASSGRSISSATQGTHSTASFVQARRATERINQRLGQASIHRLQSGATPANSVQTLQGKLDNQSALVLLLESDHRRNQPQVEVPSTAMSVADSLTEVNLHSVVSPTA